MALLKHKNQTPPDGFFYVQPETGTRIERDTLGELEDAVIAHRQYKGISPVDKGSVSLDIQRQICSGQFPGVCAPEKGENYVPLKDMARDLSLSKISEFSEKLIDWMKDGLRFVPKEESARRAAICRGCRFNRPAPNCACTPFYKAIDAIIPNDRKHEGLSICGICGCALKALVLAPLNPGTHRYPEHCWQHQNNALDSRPPS